MGAYIAGPRVFSLPITRHRLGLVHVSVIYDTRKACEGLPAFLPCPGRRDKSQVQSGRTHTAKHNLNLVALDNPMLVYLQV